MDINSNNKLKYGFIAYPTIVFLLIYVFCYQFAYPFTSTVFLYLSFLCMLIYLFVTRLIVITTQIKMFIGILAVSWIGIVYTNNSSEGMREAIILSVIVILMLVVAQDKNYLVKVKKAVYFCSFIVMIGVLIQSIIPDQFLDFMQKILRSDCYEQMRWSYRVDNAYAGFSAYTPDAAYFSALIFGFVMLDLLKAKSNATKKYLLLDIILSILALYSVILTSKRGLAVALILAFVLTYLIMKRMSVKAILSIVIIVCIGMLALYFFSDNNTAVSLFLQRFDAAEGTDLTTGRTTIWANAISACTNWIWGMGTGSAYTIFSAGLHNIYLQLIFEHGVLGFLIYIAFFIYNLKNAIANNNPRSIYVQLIMLLYGFTGNPIYSTSFFIVYILYTIISIDDLGEMQA